MKNQTAIKPITLQINSLAALERLLGGDSQLEIEARNSIIQQFARTYLKSLVDVPVIEAEAKRLKQEARGLLETLLSSSALKPRWQGERASLSNETIDLIQKEAKTRCGDVIAEEVQKAINDFSKSQEFAEMIEKRVTFQIEQTVKEAVRTRLAKALAGV